ncbi:hypothetical protein [Sandaracinobacteroides saxicola]|uniref:Uncharacterized protein n=1 Tax=Sandaracinobacteroides saxicola TaxID=2759707 RepID=A0A7G5IKI2_9SPHN|nr:hypothetical protein [Sandaracinobacteroides saxicola]QMW23874.1 hypothetical protein H3309_05220 [Sandaracinobacteroides saxicola]
MRGFLLLAAALALCPAVQAQQNSAKVIPGALLQPSMLAKVEVKTAALLSPQARMAEFLKSCPECQTLATPTGSVQLVPTGGTYVMQQKGNPFGNACGPELTTAEMAGFRKRVEALVGAATVKLIADKAAGTTCPQQQLSQDLTRILLGDDVVISRGKP